ncbi:ATP-binding response regulator [Usitatibacter rugosus]|uniref:ATP-binding response regulator n=1 Tax=Usitatibacter rugosus TaxID=2732067 RepID=UPI0014876E85|nr:ATP-binding protein [Usitatibacter rugosus]
MNVIARSVRRKLMLVVLATTTMALFVAAASLIAYDLRSYRQTAVDNLSTQAEILARASAPALAFNDPKSAQEDLAQLKARPQILAAAIYQINGRLFASFSQGKESSIPAFPEKAGWRIDGDRLLLFHPIREKGESIGIVFLSARYRVDERLSDYLVIVAIVMALAFGVALLISSWLQGTLMRPLLEVASVARDVVERRDYSLKAVKKTDDEIGDLVDAFNAMLQEVGRREKALEEADRRKDEFLATLAHELRNPLAPVTNALQILKMSNDEATRLRAREIMERQLRQMVRLVDDLLDVSRITTGKLGVRMQRVEVASIVRNAVETVAPLIEAQGHHLHLDLSGEPAYVEGDATRLAQVFANLLNNAAKYTPSGGNIRLGCGIEGNEVVVTVKDDGIGIDPAVLPYVFEMFAQADRSLDRPNAGLGVGLTLARRLVELHGGALLAKSAGLGHGSEFSVRLPMAASAPAQPRAPSAPEKAGHASEARRVLLVDDNIDFSTSLAALLRALGHEVRVAESGAEGLRAAEEFKPQYVFLDIGMPGMNGYDLAHGLRRLPGGRAMVLTAVTGWGQDKDRQRAREAGIDHHLTKPVEVDSIRAILEATEAAL